MAKGSNDQGRRRGVDRRALLGGAAAIGAAAGLGGAAAAQPADGYRKPIFPGKMAATVDAATPFYPAEAKPAAGSPNILVIILDDIGFSDLGCYGSEIPTPNIDRLARGGLKYTNFRTTAMCSPTRAALMTGLNHHSAGMGWLADADIGFPGYRGDLTHEAPTMAEILRDGGYSTYHVGKWHVNAERSNGPLGPTDNWPNARGFDRAHWFMGHSADFFAPADLYEDNSALTGDLPEDYYTTDAFTTKAMAYLNQQASLDPDKPFLLQLAYNAAHSGLQARPEDRDRFKGAYDIGWDAIRDRRLARQKDLGILPPDAVLPPRNPGIKAWSDLSDKERRVYARYMEVYAGIIHRLDVNIGRLIEFLETRKLIDNTLVVLFSDNGASPEGTPDGTPNLLATAGGIALDLDEALSLYDQMGDGDTYPHYPMGWGMASNTPFKMYKQYTFLGGICDPLILHWPAGIKAYGQTRRQFTHVIDILPTVLDVAGIAAPARYNGRAAKPIEGASFRATFADQAAPPARTEQYFEMGGQRAYHADGWEAVALHDRGKPYDSDVWALYDLAGDPTQIRDLSQMHPDRLADLKARFIAAAERYDVFPLDDRNVVLKIIAERQRHPARPHWEFFPPFDPISAGTGPQPGGRSHRIAVTIDRASTDQQGVLVALGNMYAGWVLYVRDNRLHYEHNHIPRFDGFSISEPLPAGRITVEFAMAMTERPFVGTGNLSVEGKVMATHPFKRVLFAAPFEGITIGRDGRGRVSRSFRGANAFQGRIEKVVFDIDTAPPTMQEIRRFLLSMQITI